MNTPLVSRSRYEECSTQLLKEKQDHKDRAARAEAFETCAISLLENTLVLLERALSGEKVYPQQVATVKYKLIKLREGKDQDGVPLGQESPYRRHY